MTILRELLTEASDAKKKEWKEIWDGGKGMFVRDAEDESVSYVSDAKRGSGSLWDIGLWDHIDKLLKDSSFPDNEKEIVSSTIDNQDSPGHLDELDWEEIEEYLDDDLDIEEMDMDDHAEAEISWGESHADFEEDDNEDEEY